LEVRWSQRATRDVERAIHEYLKPFRINREWYADDGLTCMVADDLGNQLLDKVEADCVANGTDYDEAYDAAFLTLADVRRALPPLVQMHAEWLAAGWPDDEVDVSGTPQFEAMKAANRLPV